MGDFIPGREKPRFVGNGWMIDSNNCSFPTKSKIESLLKISALPPCQAIILYHKTPIVLSILKNLK